MRVEAGDFEDPEVLDLIRMHLSDMLKNSPPEHCHAMDTSGLRGDDVKFWTVKDGEQLMAMGALKQLNTSDGEIKSMRTHPRYLRRGAGRVMLSHIMFTARGMGLKKLSLETGSGPVFEPAIAMYRLYGFESGPAFGSYKATTFNQFMHMDPLGRQRHFYGGDKRWVVRCCVR